MMVRQALVTFLAGILLLVLPAAHAKPVLPAGVTVINNGSAIIFEKQYVVKEAVSFDAFPAERKVVVWFSFFYVDYLKGYQQMEILKTRPNDQLVVLHKNGRIEEVTFRPLLYPQEDYERAQLSTKQLKLLERDWQKYARNMNLRELAPYYLANPPKITPPPTPPANSP